MSQCMHGKNLLWHLIEFEAGVLKPSCIVIMPMELKHLSFIVNVPTCVTTFCSVLKR